MATPTLPHSKTGLQKRRVVFIVFLVCALLCGLVWWYLNRVPSVLFAQTTQVAEALQANDRERLLNQPILGGDPSRVDWLLEYRSGLQQGSSVSVIHNGDELHLLPEGGVTHIGLIHGQNVTIKIGIRYDPRSGEARCLILSAMTGPVPSK